MPEWSTSEHPTWSVLLIRSAIKAAPHDINPPLRAPHPLWFNDMRSASDGICFRISDMPPMRPSHQSQKDKIVRLDDKGKGDWANYDILFRSVYNKLTHCDVFPSIGGLFSFLLIELKVTVRG